MGPLTGPVPTVKPAWLGRVAQLVERGIENPCVGGSIPSPATAHALGWVHLGTALMLMTGAGCGDNCEQLCVQTASRLAACKPDSLAWTDLGARSRAGFAADCRNDWQLMSTELTVSDLRVALDVCDEATRDLGRLSCEELTALYAVEE
jgi:hypothetical protein